MKKKQRRDLNSGRWVQDRTIYKWFIIFLSIYAVSMIGVNTILKTAWEVVIVNDTEAEMINISWQDEVMYMLEEAGINTKTANKVIACESNWNKNSPKAWNGDGSNDLGLWRINSIHELSDEVRLDPITATIHAIKLIKYKGGWHNWVVYTNWISKGLPCPWKNTVYVK